jgi:hypothetical protein
MCGEPAMVEPWEGVSEAVMTETHKAQEELLVGCDAHTSDKNLVGILQAR